MVFDADPAVHELLAPVLKRDNGNVDVEDAYDTREALGRLRTSQCDVLVAGQGLNGFDPLRFLKQVRSIQPDTRVIVTGDQDPQRVIGAIRAQAYSYFHKPLPPACLADMVHHALEARSWKDDIRVVSARPDWITLD